jgi:hypothetical protein
MQAIRSAVVICAFLVGSASAEPATAPLHGPTSGKKRTYESHPPYPRFRFDYPAEYSPIGYDIGSVSFGIPGSEKPAFTIGTIPTESARVEEETAERQLTILPRTRQISGYRAVKVAPTKNDPTSWMFVTKPYQIEEVGEGRWLIVLPDDDGILSSFRLLD